MEIPVSFYDKSMEVQALWWNQEVSVAPLFAGFSPSLSTGLVQTNAVEAGLVLDSNTVSSSIHDVARAESVSSITVSYAAYI